MATHPVHMCTLDVVANRVPPLGLIPSALTVVMMGVLAGALLRYAHTHHDAILPGHDGTTQTTYRMVEW